jgi:methylmalonyl-CoA/ethylmalonyl-CoA epimerase
VKPIEGLGNKVLAQVCVIVDDADKYAQRYAEIFGIPIPEAHVTDGYAETHATYFGSPTEAKARIYAWHFGNVDFELLQPLGPKSVWQDWLDEHGPSVHHVAFRVTDTDGVAREFIQRGYPITQQGFFTGRLANGGHTGIYTYLDTLKDLGTTFELLEDYDPAGAPR